MKNVAVEFTIPYQTLLDLLVTAVEGGSNYWASIKSVERDADGNYLKVKVTELEKSRDDVNRVNRYVVPEDLAQGLQRLAERIDSNHPQHFETAGTHFADALGDHDALTADVVLQMAVFGEIIYG